MLIPRQKRHILYFFRESVYKCFLIVIFTPIEYQQTPKITYYPVQMSNVSNYTKVQKHQYSKSKPHIITCNYPFFTKQLTDKHFAKIVFKLSKYLQLIQNLPVNGNRKISTVDLFKYINGSFDFLSIDFLTLL